MVRYEDVLLLSGRNRDMRVVDVLPERGEAPRFCGTQDVGAHGDYIAPLRDGTVVVVGSASSMQIISWTESR